MNPYSESEINKVVKVLRPNIWKYISWVYVEYL